jgi:hemoglobin/transferrin/lactoferrin receptor protein
VTTNALSAVSPPPLAATSVLALSADDTIKRMRASVDQRVGALNTVVADELRWALFVQKADNRQHAVEDRNTAADRARDTTFDQRSVGGTLEVDKRFSAALPQRLTYGFDVSRSHTENVRDGVVPPVGETFPTKAFPDTDYTLAGIFAQDEIALAGGAFFVIAALRFDTFKLDPEASPLYPGTPVSLSDSAVSPKLSLQWLPVEGVNLYAYVARGYRAPTPDQVNNGFVNAVVNYRSIGNPDLKPETSRTIEVGAKFRAGGARASAAYFDGRYKNFIEQIQTGGSFTVADPAHRASAPDRGDGAVAQCAGPRLQPALARGPYRDGVGRA